MSTMTDTQTTDIDTSALCKISNTCGEGVSIALLITEGEAQSTGSKLAATGDFEVLPVAKGGFVIADKDSDTVTLDRKITNPDTNVTTTERGYELLVSSIDWYKPIANIGLNKKIGDDADYFEDQQVTADDVTALQETITFFDTISAHPDSTLATDYIAAVNATSNQIQSDADGSDESSGNIADTIAGGTSDFFKSHKNYQHVTLDHLMALKDYYDRFPFRWAQYLDEANYYLYGYDGAKTTFQGKLQIKKTGDADITQKNCGYTCSLFAATTPDDTSKVDVSATATDLTYAGGLFVDDPDSDTPDIALKGILQLKRAFTKDPADKVIVEVISGNISGVTVIGFDATQCTTPDDSTADWLNTLFNPKTAEGIFNSIMTIMGALMMIHFAVDLIKSIYKWCKEKYTGKKPTTLDDLLKEIQKNKTEISDLRARDFRRLARNKRNAVENFPDDSDSALVIGKKGEVNLDSYVSKQRLDDTLRKMNDLLGKMEVYVGKNGALQQRIQGQEDDISSLHDQLRLAVEDTLPEIVLTVRPSVVKTTSDVVVLAGDVKKAAVKGQTDNAANAETDTKAVQQKVVDEKNSTDDNEKEKTDPDLKIEEK